MLADSYADLKRTLDEFERYCIGGEKDKLIEYLMGLNINLIKDIHIILHIGKNEFDNCIHKPFELYKKTMMLFDSLRGWQDKELEINKIIDYKSVNLHFQNGLKKLEFN